jgi:hypothetical protein
MKLRKLIAVLLLLGLAGGGVYLYLENEKEALNDAYSRGAFDSCAVTYYQYFTYAGIAYTQEVKDTHAQWCAELLAGVTGGGESKEDAYYLGVHDGCMDALQDMYIRYGFENDEAAVVVQVLWCSDLETSARNVDAFNVPLVIPVVQQ